MIRFGKAVLLNAFFMMSFCVLGLTADKKAAVEVQVEVTEVDQAKAAQLGVRWLDSFSMVEAEPPGLVKLGSFQRVPGLQADLQFLIQEGAAELLASPNLVTDSGSTATFHAGGEIPYITTAALGTANVEFKPYGVELSVAPEVIGSNQVRMKVIAAVSSPDPTNGVSLSGNTVPALLERKVASHVTVESGNTMTLAGLVQTHKEKSERGVPILRRVPILGRLFRWKRSSFRKTSIVIFVTPRVINS